ncbi:MAG TPA: type 4a pilus biogenesis protein PilO [Longimicrobium sp.]|jgi:type IV pilus assembly protein PilO|uniref:type 4a pilus biogenesis protein PilO n=1 Tax=Longimicrobium sp. TaxID=2029185 RepID=UPI002ED79FC0
MALPPLEPQQKKYLLYMVVAVALLGFGFYDQVYSKRSDNIAGLETQLEALKTVNGRSRSITQGNEAAVDERLALYREQLELAEGLIPSAEEVPNLLDAISAEAQRTGVELRSIQPVGATEEEYYTRRVYDLAVTGQYHQIGEFLTRVASLPRVVTPTNLTVAPEASPSGPAAPAAAPRGGVPLQARFSIETYVIPSTPITDDASA